MRWILHPAASALGVATLCLLAIMGPLLSPSHTTLYHTSGPVLTLYWAVLLDLFAVWALITIMLLFARRPGRRQAMLWSAIVLALPWILLKNIWMLAEVRLSHWVSVSLFILLFTIFVTLAVRWKPELFLHVSASSTTPESHLRLCRSQRSRSHLPTALVRLAGTRAQLPGCPAPSTVQFHAPGRRWASDLDHPR